ncbi:ubiquinol-cytochrome c reductase iron-sulfur subunit [bacterium]|nr:ubiquinol-cytochrome c reductase iron-sulfur subunit [bacterium]
MDSSKKDDVSRRNFLSTTLMGVGLVASYGVTTFYAANFIAPEDKKKIYRSLYVAPEKSVPVGKSIDFEDLKGRKIAITNTGDGFKALSTSCTHLGCQVHWENEKNAFYCPCHEGYFDSDGNVTKGPPPAPLAKYDVEIIDGNIFVKVEEVYNAIS